MKNIKWSILILILLFSTTVFATPSPSNEFYVYDEANIMDGATENYIIQTNDELYEKTGTQIVIAAIDDLEGMDINTYATALFDDWDIGGSQLDNGLLMLIVPSEGELWIEVGYGLEGILPDSRVKRIIDDYIIPSFAEDDYNRGILLGYEEILSYVEQEYNVEITSREQIENLAPQSEDIEATNPLYALVAIIVILLVVFLDMKFFGGWLTFMIFRNIGRGGRGGHGGGSRGGGGGRSGGGGAGGRW